MITKNFKALLSMTLQASDYELGFIPIQGVTGRFLYCGTKSDFPRNKTAACSLSATGAGISVGTGTSLPSEYDINLESTVTANLALTVSSVLPSADDDGNPALSYRITVTNNGSSDITISEIGYKQSMRGSARPFSPTSAESIICLLDRTLLETPVTIPAGDAGVIDYTLKTICAPPRTVNGVRMVSWTFGSDEDIAAMLDAARAGLIDLQTDAGWRVGEIRRIRLDAWTGGESIEHPSENVGIVISSFRNYNGCGNVLQFDFIDPCTRHQRMNPTSTSVGGYGATQMYNETLPALAEALPDWLKSRLKTFDVLASKGGSGSSLSTIETVGGNRLALRANVEIMGSRGQGQQGEGEQIEYYALPESKKKPSSDPNQPGTWWTRSAANSDSFHRMNASGIEDSGYSLSASGTAGVAPFGCL